MTLYPKADAGVTPSKADAGVYLSDSGCRKLSDGKSLLHPLSDGETPASVVL